MKSIRLLGLVGLSTATASSFALSLTSVDPGFGSTTTMGQARGVAQPNNWKAQLRPGSSGTGSTGNPGSSTWWKGSLNGTRSWQLTYDLGLDQFTWEIFGNDSWSGAASMTMTRTDIDPAAGQAFVGLRLDVKTRDAVISTVTTTDVTIDGNAVATMDNSLTGQDGGNFLSLGTAHYFDGPLTSFVLRGKTYMDWSGNLNSGSSDRVSFDLNLLQAAPVPEPATMGLLALGAAGLAARRRRH